MKIELIIKVTADIREDKVPLVTEESVEEARKACEEQVLKEIISDFSETECENVTGECILHIIEENKTEP